MDVPKFLDDYIELIITNSTFWADAAPDTI